MQNGGAGVGRKSGQYAIIIYACPLGMLTLRFQVVKILPEGYRNHGDLENLNLWFVPNLLEWPICRGWFLWSHNAAFRQGASSQSHQIKL